MGSQQVFIGFANFYRSFIQGFSRIATSLTAMLRTTGSSITSASRVDDDEVVGGGSAGAESGGSVDNQAGRTLQYDVGLRDDDKKFSWLGLVKAFVARSRKPRMSPSRSPPSIRIIPKYSPCRLRSGTT